MRRPMRPSEVERQRLLRHTRKTLRFDGPAPACIFCGCDHIAALRAVPFEKLPEHFKRRVIEHHHPDGRSVSEWKVPTCRNCHAIESDWQEDQPPAVRAPRTKVERAAALLVSDAQFFRRWAQACEERSQMLKREADRLLGRDSREGGDPNA